MKRVKIRVIKEVTDIFPEYRPEVGKVYEARYKPRTREKWLSSVPEFCVIDILDKQIVLRSGEFEIVDTCKGERRTE